MSRLLGASLLLIVTIVWTGTTHALTTEQLKAVKESVLEMCRGGSSKGEQTSVVVKGAGEAKVVFLKKLAELGIDGEVTFSEKEWEGVEALLPNTLQHEVHVQCVTTLTPMILDKLEKERAKGKEGVNKEGLIFGYPACQGSGNVICELKITNTQIDRRLYFWARQSNDRKTYATDNNYEYVPHFVQLGSSRKSNRAENSIRQDTSLTGKIFFDVVDRNIEHFNKMVVYIYDRDRKSVIFIDFDNVKIKP